MTPNNIVNMAALLGLNLIALTDHNSSKNCAAAMAVGSSAGITVVPGMELCTSEEIHVVCLFSNLENCNEFNTYVEKHRMHIKNREDIYGEQVILNEKDEPVGTEQDLLILATDISVSDIFELVRQYNGVCYPAHIDRDSNSILANLGDFPPDCRFTAAEITAKGDVQQLKMRYPILNDLILIQSSDAHYLENMQEPKAYIELEENTPQALINALLNSSTAWHR